MDKEKSRRKLLLLSVLFVALVIGLISTGAHTYVYSKILYWNAYSKQKSHDQKGAIEVYSTILAQDDDFVTAYISRGSAYLDLGDVDKAISDYNKAIELTPDDAQIYAYRGQAFYQIAEYEKAMADYNQALTRDNDFPCAYYYRGLLKSSVYHDLTGACEDFTRASDLGFGPAQELINSGICEVSGVASGR